MAESAGGSRAQKGAVQHLETALETEDINEANYHIREALQLLDVE